MGRPSKRAKIVLTKAEKDMLERISKSRTEPFRKVLRSKIIFESISKINDSQIARDLKVNRKTVILCLEKCVSMGVEAALTDQPRSGKKAVITANEKVWIINLACQKPKELGYPHEIWTYSLLLKHIRANCNGVGHINLTNLSVSKLWNILNDAELKPHKIKYYVEKRDPEFESKMEQVLYIYKEVELTNQKIDNGDISQPDKITVSFDEKPGIQAIGNKGKELLPLPNSGNGCIYRDYEYVRHGTLSLLAGIDLYNGEIIYNVSETHKSSDFINLLQLLDSKYDKDKKIRIILDNVSSHISKETKKFLTSKPNRFEFVFTPKHGSWLNIIESFFSKMTRSFLRGIRVNSKQELKERICNYLNGINKTPVRFRWKYKMDEISI